MSPYTSEHVRAALRTTRSDDCRIKKLKLLTCAPRIETDHRLLVIVMLHSLAVSSFCNELSDIPLKYNHSLLQIKGSVM